MGLPILLRLKSLLKHNKHFSGCRRGALYIDRHARHDRNQLSLTTNWPAKAGLFFFRPYPHCDHSSSVARSAERIQQFGFEPKWQKRQQTILRGATFTAGPKMQRGRNAMAHYKSFDIAKFQKSEKY